MTFKNAVYKFQKIGTSNYSVTKFSRTNPIYSRCTEFPLKQQEQVQDTLNKSIYQGYNLLNKRWVDLNIDDGKHGY